MHPERADELDDARVASQLEQRQVELQVERDMRHEVPSSGRLLDLGREWPQACQVRGADARGGDRPDRRDLDKRAQLGDVIELLGGRSRDPEPLVAHDLDEALLLEVEDRKSTRLNSS